MLSVEQSAKVVKRTRYDDGTAPTPTGETPVAKHHKVGSLVSAREVVRFSPSLFRWVLSVFRKQPTLDLFANKKTAQLPEWVGPGSKLGEDGEPIYREDGKVLKGPNYFKPKIKAILES